MERLTQKDFDFCAEYCTSSNDCGYFKHLVPTMCDDAAIYEKLRDYEDAEEQGLLVRYPFKVGDTVYCIAHYDAKIHESKVYQMWIDSRGLCVAVELSILPPFSGCPSDAFYVFQKRVFLTREEADAALAKEREP